MIAVFDYKTGTPPGAGAVRAGRASQLPLEALMARMGGFGEAGEPGELIYWRLTGGFVAGEKIEISSAKYPAGPMVDAMEARLLRLIAAYDDPARAYLAQPLPGQAPRFADYGQLARVAEWQSAEDELEESADQDKDDGEPGGAET